MATVYVRPFIAGGGEPSGAIMAAGPDLGGPAGGGLVRLLAVNAVWNALTYVYDPELYLDVVSLGLVYDVRDEDGAVVVEMTLTTPGCPASESLPEMARAAVAEAVGLVMAVEVRVVWDPPWTPAMIDAVAAEALGLRVR